MESLLCRLHLALMNPLFSFRTLGLIYLLLFGPLCLLAQWEDLTESYLLEGTTQASWLGCGMSVADFNLDGLEDITLANSDGSVVAYAQLAEGGFEAAHAFEGTVQAQGVAWMDVDGDEDLDLMVTRRFGRTELYIRSEDGFVEEGVSRGFPDVNTNEGRGMAVADYDSDGDLDVYVCMYHDGTTGLSENVLYNNDGSGYFTDVTAQAGVGNGLQHTFQATWFDEDGDGDLDLWVINDRTVFPNALYRNLGNGTFVDVAEDLNLAQAIFAMTATVGDYDNDGSMELFCTNVENDPNLMMDKLGPLYQSVGPEQGVDGARYSWGACWVDVDGDMWSDLMVATYRFPNSLPYDNYYYLNGQFGAPFSDETDQWPNEQTQLYAVGVLDVNGDLAPDVAGFGNAPFVQVLGNATPQLPDVSRRLVVELCGVNSNRQAIGAKLAVHAGGITQTQWVSNGSDFMTQQSTHRYFGLAEEAEVDSVVVDWPSGLHEVWTNVEVDQLLRLVEGSSTAEAVVTGGQCLGDSAWVHFPLEAPVRRLNGSLIEADSVLLPAPGQYVLECEWLGGLFTWTDVVSWTEPLPHNLTVEWTAPLCAGEPGQLGWVADSSFVVLFGGTGEVQWSDVETDVAATAGAWSFTTLDPSTGCAEPHPYVLPEPPALGVFIEYESAACHADVASAVATGFGGTPTYLVNWNGSDPTDLPAGPVMVTLSDAAGCTLDSTWVVDIPAPLEFEVTVTPEDAGDDGAISLQITGGTPPYDVLWNEGSQGDTALTDLAQGLYSWVIEDANGCLSLGLQEVWNMSVQWLDPGSLRWGIQGGAGWMELPGPGLVRIELWSLDGRRVAEDWIQGPGRSVWGEGQLPSHGVIRVLDVEGTPLLRQVY